MTPEQEHDYQEALRRIEEARAHKSTELDLSELTYLTRFPPELTSLTSLHVDRPPGLAIGTRLPIERVRSIRRI